MLAIGGVNSKEAMSQARNGVHIVVATPGRLSDMLNKNKINLDSCKYITLDEADRLLDLAFEEEIRNILDHFSVYKKIFIFFLFVRLESKTNSSIFGYNAEKNPRVRQIRFG